MSEENRQPLPQLQTRFDKETEEFYTQYPDIDPDGIPVSVWESVKNGKTLAVAYTDYENAKKKSEKLAAVKNEENSTASPGKISGKPAKAVYTSKDVAAMSAREVKENYSRILDSMKSKGFFND